MSTRTWSDYTMFAEAWLLLAIARLLLLFVPFKRIAPLLGKTMQEAHEQGLQGSQLPARITTAILRASARSPWRTKCFEQAIAAKIMLKLRGVKSTVYFGVQKQAGKDMLAHAWLKINSTIVTGGPDVSPFTIVSWFGS